MGFPKVGQLFYPARQYTGRLVIEALGYPDGIVSRLVEALRIPTRAALSRMLPSRVPAGSKFDHGLVQLLGGSRGMTGSVTLASRAALRSGAGMVHLFTPASAVSTLATKLTETVIHQLPETPDGTLSAQGVERALAALEKMQVACVGPGLTHHRETIEAVRQFVQAADKPLVIDADGINAFRGKAEQLRQLRQPVVITPHAGEWNRLWGELPSLPLERIAAVAGTARDFSLEIVLKGNPSIVAKSSGEVFIVPLGNSGLASAGTGDVLTGTIGGLIAQGSPAGDAAVLGTALHGLAGEAASRRFGEHSMVAEDLIECLHEIIQPLAHPPVEGILPER
jgi:NAD(P)H-hydrate epimerase